MTFYLAINSPVGCGLDVQRGLGLPSSSAGHIEKDSLAKSQESSPCFMSKHIWIRFSKIYFFKVLPNLAVLCWATWQRWGSIFWKKLLSHHGQQLGTLYLPNLLQGLENFVCPAWANDSLCCCCLLQCEHGLKLHQEGFDESPKVYKLKV